MSDVLDTAPLTSLAAIVSASCAAWLAIDLSRRALRVTRIPWPRPLGWLTASVTILLSAQGGGRLIPDHSVAASLEPSPGGRRLSETKDAAPPPPPWVRHPSPRSTPEVAAPHRASVPPWPGSHGSSPPRPPSRAGAGIDLDANADEPRSEAANATGGIPGRARAETFMVREGDTLWGIAEVVLGTTDPARIARYWPQIHRANRDVIGRDPSLIFPGQVLQLPPEIPRR